MLIHILRRKGWRRHVAHRGRIGKCIQNIGQKILEQEATCGADA